MRVEGENHLPRAASHTCFDVDWDMVGFEGCKCAFSGRIELLVKHQKLNICKENIRQGRLKTDTHSTTLTNGLFHVMGVS